MYEQLKILTQSISPLSEKDWSAFQKHWTLFEAGKKEILTFKGDLERYLYFVGAGVQRVYYLDAQGREATLVFTYPPSFGGVLDAMLLQTASSYYYETLTKSSFLRIPVNILLELMQEHKAIQLMVSKGIMQAFSGVLERLVELQCFSSTEKYKKLLQRSPHILQIVPQKYLANYLGIDPTNFSKFVNAIKI